MSQSTSVSPAITPLEHSPLASRFRRRRAISLVPTVRRVEGGFRVGSAHRDMCYLVTEVGGQATCTCPDFLLHEEEVDFQCKHVLAVEMAQQQRAIPAADPSEGPVALSRLHRYWPREEPVRIRLTKNTRGYSWEIFVAERDSAAALKALVLLEDRMKKTFGAPVQQQLSLALD